MPPSESSGHIPQWVYELGSFRSFQDAVKNVVWDVKAHPENVPVTGAKAEVTGVKAEANAASLSVFGVQTEYSLFKAEAAAFDLNKFLDGRAQERRDKDQDDRLRGLSADAVRAKDLIDKVKQDLKSTADGLRRTVSEGDKQLRREVPEIRVGINSLRRNLLAADQELRGRITTSAREVRRAASAGDQRVREQVAVVRAGVRTANRVAHSAEQSGRNALQQIRELRRQVLVKAREADTDLKNTLRKVRSLDREVKDGLQKVRELEGKATSARRSIEGLRDGINSLERTLRQ